MKFIFALLALSSIALTGCKATLQNSQVPRGYEQYAREAEGTYTGKIQTYGVPSVTSKARQISLKVSYVGGRIVATTSGDILGAGCNSKVGNLEYIEASGTKLKTAVFAFNGGNCRTNRMANRLVIRSFNQSSGHAKLVVSVATGWGQYSDEGGLKTSTTEARASLKKQ